MSRRAALLSGIVILGLLVGAFGAGAAMVHFKTRPYKAIRAAVSDLIGDRRPNRQKPKQAAPVAGVPDAQNYESIFFPITGRSADIPITRKGTGGGMAALGEDVVLITHDGSLFHATSDDDIAPLDIEAADNGFAAYQADAVEKYSDLEHRFDWFRYNDVLIVDGPAGREMLLSFTRYFPQEACYATVLASLALDPERDIRSLEARASEWETLFQAEPCLPLKSEFRAIEGHMAGGRMTYDGQGRIYLGVGEYHWDGLYAPFPISQRDDYQYGKVIEVDLASRASRVVSKGHRNMQGVAMAANGRLYVVEHGMRGGDELNLVREGADYGWPAESLGTQYNKAPLPGTLSYGRHDVFEPPVFSWLPSVAISSLNPVSGFHETWEGDLLMASLRSQSLFRIRLTAPDQIQFAERIEIGERIRYAQPLGPRIALWTDSQKLIFLEAQQGGPADIAETLLAGLDRPEADTARIATAFTACRECHALDAGDSYAAPSLAGIFGAELASTSYADYSDALRGKGGTWTRAALLAYLRDPQGFAPGTIMPDPGLTDPAILEGLVDLLEGVPAR